VAQLVVGGGTQPPHVQEVTVGSTAHFVVSMRDSVGHAMKVGASEWGEWIVSMSTPTHAVATLEGAALTISATAPGSTVVKIESKADGRVSAINQPYLFIFVWDSAQVRTRPCRSVKFRTCPYRSVRFRTWLSPLILTDLVGYR
jgi:hypothetical protein